MTDRGNILFEKFDILECIKKDSGVAVYVATHIYLGKTILLKTLNRESVADPAMLDRFQREAKTLARLEHPNIIKVLDFGTYESFFYISFEYFDSRNLRQVIQADALSSDDKVDVCLQLLRGLDYAHQHHIVHRDIKPENILLNDDLQIKIADFGLARTHGDESKTLQTSIVGTPSYMSPEQIRGETLTPQSDLFSLGIVILELFAGKNPFLGKDAGATLNNVLSKPADADLMAQVPAPLRDRVPQLLNKKPHDRPDSAARLLSQVGAEANEPQPVAEFASVEQENRRYSTGLWKAVAALVFLGLLGVLVILSTRQTPDMTEPQDGTAAADTTAHQVERQEPESAILDTPNPSVAESESLQQRVEPPPVEETSSLNIPGRLLVRCSPWANVYIDGDSVDTTPMEEPLQLMAGEYALQLKHPNFPIYVQNIRMQPDEELMVAVELDTLFGFFTCDIYPWAEVIIDDEPKGVTPFPRPLMVTPGKHMLTVKNQQYGVISDTFFVARRDTFHYQLNFERVVQNRALN